MENDILFKVRMADRASVKFILKDKKLYEKFRFEYSTALDTYANHVQKDMKSDCSDREFEKMRSVM